jgi:hypothetical protein
MDQEKEVSKKEVAQLLLKKIKVSIEGATSPEQLECLSRALERVGLRP